MLPSLWQLPSPIRNSSLPRSPRPFLHSTRHVEVSQLSSPPCAAPCALSSSLFTRLASLHFCYSIGSSSTVALTRYRSKPQSEPRRSQYLTVSYHRRHSSHPLIAHPCLTKSAIVLRLRGPSVCRCPPELQIWFLPVQLHFRFFYLLLLYRLCRYLL